VVCLLESFDLSICNKYACLDLEKGESYVEGLDIHFRAILGSVLLVKFKIFDIHTLVENPTIREILET